MFLNRQRVHQALQETNFMEPANLQPPFELVHSFMFDVLRVVCDVAHQYVIIAGSAPLDQITRRRLGISIEPNDVDYFTSLEIEASDMYWLNNEINNLQNAFIVEMKPNNDEELYIRYRCIWNLDIRYLNEYGQPATILLYPSVQIISVPITRDIVCQDTFTFMQYIWSLFDINVCKCALISEGLSNILAQNIVDIENRTMEYNLSNYRYQRPEITIRRLKKYMDRGFKLERLRLSETIVITIEDNQFCIVDDTESFRSLYMNTHVYEFSQEEI
jgi:hypothetical protein